MPWPNERWVQLRRAKGHPLTAMRFVRVLDALTGEWECPECRQLATRFLVVMARPGETAVCCGVETYGVRWFKQAAGD